MSPATEPMTFDELSELYRIEMKSNSISQARPDLFRAMAELESKLRLEYDRQMSLDPESVMCEGANQHRKKAELLVKNILHIRTQKICQMAIRGAMGADNGLEYLTAEEKEYYSAVQSLSRKHLSEVDRLRGRKVTTATHIDEPVRTAVPEPAYRAPEPEPVRETPREVQAPVPTPADEMPPDEAMFDDFADETFDDIPEEPFDEPPPMPEPEPAPVQAPKAEPPAAEPPAKEEERIVEDVPDTPIDTIEEPSDSDLETIIIRVLEDLPPFVGPDRDYNLKKEDIVTMPRVMADALVNVQKATVVRPSP